jgi:hypothetical protein
MMSNFCYTEARTCYHLWIILNEEGGHPLFKEDGGHGCKVQTLWKQGDQSHSS